MLHKNTDSHVEPAMPEAIEMPDVPEGTEHEKKASWVTVGILQIADIVGTGVLALGAAVALVGWIPAAIMIVGFLPINVYAGWVLQEAYLTFPTATSFPLMARQAVGQVWFTVLVKVLLYSFLIGVLGQYVQVLASSLASLLVNLHLCNYQFVLLGVLILLPMAQLRTLNDSRAIQLINTLSITLTVLISVCYMLVNMDLREGTTVLFNTGASWKDVFSALSKFTFAYMGNFIYLEFLAEMPKPEKFYKSFFISSPYQLVVYSMAGFTQYGFQGDKAGSNGLIYQAIPYDNPLYGVCAFLLFVHMLCAYLIKGTIMARIIHVKLLPGTVNDRGLHGSLHWFAITSALAFFAFLISSSIPNFGALMDLLAAFQAAPLGFIFPPIFLIAARCSSGKCTPLWEKLVLGFVIGFGVVILVVGGTDAVYTVSSSFSDGDRPFSCPAPST